MKKSLVLATLFSLATFTFAQEWAKNPLGGTPAPNTTDDAVCKTNNGTINFKVRPNGTAVFGNSAAINRARLELFYCPNTNSPASQSHNQPGLLVNRFECGGGVTGMPPVINPPLYDQDNPPVETFTVSPGAFNLVAVTNGGTPLLNPVEQPLFWVRTEHQPSNVPGAPAGGSGNYFETKFITYPSGNTGINTTNPRAALDVRVTSSPNKIAAIFGSIAGGTYSGGTNGVLQYKTAHMQYVPRLGVDGYNRISESLDQGIFFTDGKGTEGANLNGAFILAPFANNNDPNVGGLRMDKWGNVELRGNFQATRVRVYAKWWADKVFAESYKLMPLDSVETFVQVNKRLPNMPAECEVMEQGIDVADMQAKQMQNIEELYLYVIELQKQLKAQQAMIDELKQEAGKKD